MAEREPSESVAAAVEAFNRHQGRDDGDRVAACLSDGLTILRQLTYDRIHRDVEREIGADSMLMPVSEAKARLRTTLEIEAFQIAEAAATARDQGYVSGSDEWFLGWLAGLRLTAREFDLKLQGRCHDYLAQASDDRRLNFTDALGRVLPESRQAPLVLFRLLPIGIRIATALAFSDRTAAEGLRYQQIALLPSISDCQQCHGRILECLEQCRTCGNPLWKYRWLTAVD
jgi:hypothetical protein